jgi:hypothetical protein
MRWSSRLADRGRRSRQGGAPSISKLLLPLGLAGRDPEATLEGAAERRLRPVAEA